MDNCLFSSSPFPLIPLLPPLPPPLPSISLRLEKEVKKWDTSHSDMVALAKEMCIMMMDMSDFARYVYACVCVCM